MTGDMKTDKHAKWCICVIFQAQDACGQLEIDNALNMVKDLEKNIQDAKASAQAGKLKPLPGETVTNTHHQFI